MANKEEILKKLTAPINKVDVNEITVGDSYEYTITQYIPNSYYSSELNFNNC